MKIENLADLKKLLKACQDFGVHIIEIDGIKMHISGVSNTTEVADKAPPVSPEISDEDMLLWSATPHEG